MPFFFHCERSTDLMSEIGSFLPRQTKPESSNSKRNEATEARLRPISTDARRHSAVKPYCDCIFWRLNASRLKPSGGFELSIFS